MSNNKRHIDTCLRCQCEIRRRLETVPDSDSLEKRANDLVHAFLKDCQKTQQRYYLSSGIPLNVEGLDFCDDSRRYKYGETSLGMSETPGTENMREPTIPTIHFSHDSHGNTNLSDAGFEHQATVSLQDFVVVYAEPGSFDSNGTELSDLGCQGIASGGIGASNENFGYSPSIPFFDEAIWTQQDSQ
ncbi:hypothetical protein EsH8_IV_000454 [Colletotrichum jinshuiense]